MTLKAAGAYIVRLRRDAKLSRLAFAKLLGTSDSNMMRIEQGDQEARSILLAQIIRTLSANADDMMDLLLSEQADEKEGIERAEEWIRKRGRQDASSQLHPDVLRLVAEMSEYELGRWVSSGERLIEERKRSR